MQVRRCVRRGDPARAAGAGPAWHRAGRRRRRQAAATTAGLEPRCSSAALEATAGRGRRRRDLHDVCTRPAEGLRAAQHRSRHARSAPPAPASIVDADGYIVTNAHVVRGAQRLRVELPRAADRRDRFSRRAAAPSTAASSASISRPTSPSSRSTRQNLPALRSATPTTCSAGQLVLAFGSPLGLHNSVSLGIVSAVARQLEPESPMIYVQTDASINPGSSGGPLVDLRGRLVGINTLIVSRAGGTRGSASPRRATSSATVYEQIRQHGRVRRGDIGVRAQTLTPMLAAGPRPRARLRRRARRRPAGQPGGAGRPAPRRSRASRSTASRWRTAGSSRSASIAAASATSSALDVLRDGQPQ